MTELNISGNSATWDGKEHGEMSGIIALADAIPDMRALSKLIFGGDGKVHDGNNWVSPEPATLELGMAEANFNNKNLGGGGAIIISAWMTHKDNGALTKIGISNNDIRAEGGKALAEALRGNQVITELNIASNNLGSDANWQVEVSGIANLADVIPGMGAISTLIVNTFALPIQDIKSKAELDFSGKELFDDDAIIIAALMLSNVSRTVFLNPCYH
jgi:hypothetical protein